METKGTLIRQAVLALMLAATIALLRFAGAPAMVAEPAIRLPLPANVGGWQGYDVLFCHSEACMAQFTSAELGDATLCPKCGGALDELTVAEKLALPADTIVRKKEYRNMYGSTLYVTVVITGTQRGSIHRPQWCLPGQGQKIVATAHTAIPIAGRDPLTVTMLDLTAGDDAGRLQHNAYVYWFTGGRHETAEHTGRLFWVASDSIFRGVLHRWAYISVASARRPGSNSHVSLISNFVSEFYPLLLRNNGAKPPGQ